MQIGINGRSGLKDVDPFSLCGRVALVTGEGLVPLAIADAFRRAGAEVVHARAPELTEAGIGDLIANSADRYSGERIGTDGPMAARPP